MWSEDIAEEALIEVFAFGSDAERTAHPLVDASTFLRVGGTEGRNGAFYFSRVLLAEYRWFGMESI